MSGKKGSGVGSRGSANGGRQPRASRRTPDASPETATPQYRNTVTPFLKLFVAFHIVAITVWCIPSPPKEIQQDKREPFGTEWLLVANERHLKAFGPVQAYLLTTGFWQYWDMFAPNPAQTDFYGTADVIYRDGTIRQYRYPRIRDLPIALKYPKERYRKFFERVRPDEGMMLWPYFGQRIALINAKDPANPPVRVRLWRHWLAVAPPGMPQEKEFSSYMFDDYAVDEAKLHRDMGWR